MATKKFSAPKVPATPSASINNMLKRHCDKEFTNPIMYSIAFYVSMVFQAITMIYGIVNIKKPAPSHTYWMVACGIVSALLLIKVTIIYYMVMSFESFIYILFVLVGTVFKLFMFYSFIAMGMAAIGLGVSGMVFFDKDAEDKKKSEKPTNGHVSQVAAQFEGQVQDQVQDQVQFQDQVQEQFPDQYASQTQESYKLE